MKHSVLIVDDEPLARRGVSLRLQPHKDLQVIGECSNGREAVDFIHEHTPDLVFLDIQMPILNGIEVMRSLKTDRPPFVIFLTAFDRYVMRAFEVHAIDYLLKPVDGARFNASLNHARRVLGAKETPAYHQRFKNVLEEGAAPEKKEPLRELAVRVGRQVRFVAVEDIDWIEAQGDYAEVHIGAQTHLIRESLNALESRLDASAFLRIHRSAIVSLNRIAGVNSMPNRYYALMLKSGISLRVSRTYSDPVRKIFRKRNLD